MEVYEALILIIGLGASALPFAEDFPVPEGKQL